MYKLTKEAKKAVKNARVKLYRGAWEFGHWRGWKGYIQNYLNKRENFETYVP